MLLKLRELQSVSFVEIDPSSSYALVSFVDGRLSLHVKDLLNYDAM